MIKYTPEQHEILDYMPENDGILLVAAGAGTGKSFMARQLADLLQPDHGLYTAFNKAIVEEGNARFDGLNIECKTLHALAYAYVKPKLNIETLSYSCIEEKMVYAEKFQIIEAINHFFVSASEDMFDFMEEIFPGDNPKNVLKKQLSIKYIQKMLDGSLNPTFNFMLKYFHLMLVEGSVTCQYDLVILDEINDTTAVALEIFKLIKAPKKLGLGETHQAIYDFLKLVNGFELLEDAPLLNLTQSFRCSETIAKNIQTFMRREADPTFTFVGTDDPVANGKTLYCTSTNAKIINEVNNRLRAKKGFQLLRKPSEIFAYPLAITAASQGKEPYQKQYRFLVQEYENYQKTREKGASFLQHLLTHVDDQETKSAVNLLLSLSRKGINLFALYSDTKNAPVDLNYTIATVYTAKGLEFETVEIADDLNGRIEAIRENGGIQTHEDLVAYRCYYVACSRCGVHLLNASVL